MGCGQQEDQTPSTFAKKDKVSVRMKWFFAGTMSGFFAAKEEGIFERQNIDISINPGGPENNSVKLVAAGTDKFGVTGSDELLLARSKGIPIVAIGVLFKKSPICYIAKKEKGITSPKDWVGKVIEVSYGENAETQYRALLRKFDIDPKKDVKEVPYTFNLIPFLEGKVDISPAYAMDQAITIEKQGIQLSKIFPSDYGINPYGDILITTEEMIQKNPNLVKRFVEAVIEGWQWTTLNPGKAVEHLIKNVPNLKQENQMEVLTATIPFIVPDDASKETIGVMEINRWEESQKPLLDFGLLEEPANLSLCWTNEFLPQEEKK